MPLKTRLRPKNIYHACKLAFLVIALGTDRTLESKLDGIDAHARAKVQEGLRKTYSANNEFYDILGV